MKIDVIGDVHGCIEELHELFDRLGYKQENTIYIHPEGRIPVFLGDITDRGPASLQVIKLVYEMVIVHHKAKYVPGNHCNKLYRYFLGNNVHVRHGLETTVAEYKRLDKQEQERIKKKFMTLIEASPLYLQLPEAGAVVAHAGIRESYIGRTDNKVETFVLYGDITGKFDEDGRPIRGDWAQNYMGNQWIVYGHTPVIEPRFINKTVNIDTGCVFGNALSAFRLPEEKIAAVPSKQPFVDEKFSYFR
ncbi:diadenosine tetraphosphatase ApaH/serine/threonine PP2A family protein phosphatase [Virgibacillus natechei]|uniref:Diadenosine tetraphosphatase ApaH/serine/threonine PP2A family protein phosphatase n=1 Tax=Virgibacillus natechei TaxID=1216297 RepID=A0ABS4IGA0_9BACI|nr:bis(5'-nucleosyl)-tetraphosphatase PrpE [Virgibacillus natechei]MBP1969054.1 diadenosine tetraphosphatase ApaH/serine/threonine PP2A family protein phosphatase [Virgibacillus natechei]UZD14324.1 bis(5'-nucleosyl)-tetraphosphatase PrpE [Virgibacillus natechei]